LRRLRAAQPLSKTLADSNVSQSTSLTGAPPLEDHSSEGPLELPAELRNHPQYEVERELGRGGMGVVYLARHRLMKRLDVLKVVNPMLVRDPGVRERFLREIEMAARLRHPNVVTAYHAEQLGQLLMLVMEYAPGETLERVVANRSRPLPVVNACYYMQQVARGLQHAFEQGMVHRDIKPQNLILTVTEKKTHVIRILDFGLAKARSDSEGSMAGLTGSGMMMGTPGYMAPEQAEDAGCADTRADIYSLGCTLYFLLVGQAPFAQKSLRGLLEAHASKEAPRVSAVRSDVPEELSNVIRRMMEKDPDKRYQKPEEVAKALAPFIDAKGLKALPPSSPEPVKRSGEPTHGGKHTPAQTGMKAKAGRVIPATMMERPEPVKEKKAKARAKAGSSGLRIGLAAGAVVALLAVVLVGLWAAGVFRVKTADGILVLEMNDPSAEVFVDGERVSVTWGEDGKTAEIRTKPGTRKVEVRKGDVVMLGEEVELREGKRRVLTVRMLADAGKKPDPGKPEETKPTPGQAATPAPLFVWTNKETTPVTAETGNKGWHLFYKGKLVKIVTPTESIQERSLEVWLTISNLDQRNTAVIGMNDAGGNWDSLMYAPMATRQWYPGSSGGGDGHRSKNLNGEVESSEPKELIHLVLVYEKTNQITLYRNGKVYGTPFVSAGHPDSGILTYPASGVRINIASAGGEYLAFQGDVKEASLYTVPLLQREVKTLYDGGKARLGADAGKKVDPEPIPVVKKPIPKLLVPDEASLAVAEKEVKELYKAEYAKKQPAQRQALAARLLQDGLETKDKPAARYVMLRESRDLAVTAGDLPLALRAAEEMSNSFTVSIWGLKASALEVYAGLVTLPVARVNLATLALGMADEAEESEDYEAAERLVKVAQTAVAPMATHPLAAFAQARVNELAALRKAYAAVSDSARVLAERPDDADANLALGKFHALYRGDWDRALWLLARGSDLKLKALAMTDLATPPEGVGAVALASGYAALAESENGLAKVNLLCRACWWYEQAENKLSGLERTRIEKLVAAIDKGLPPLRPVVLHARTGAHDHWTDVTAQVRGFLAARGQKLTFKSDNPDLGVGDPAPGQHKSVVVVYRYRGGIHLSIAGESTTATVPAVGVLPTAPGKPAPGQELVVLYGRYGNEATYADSTTNVQAAVKGGRMVGNINELALGDPFFGRPKALIVVYREAGKIGLSTAPAEATILGADPAKP
jgi:serine/threonine protein kinase